MKRKYLEKVIVIDDDEFPELRLNMSVNPKPSPVRKRGGNMLQSKIPATMVPPSCPVPSAIIAPVASSAIIAPVASSSSSGPALYIQGTSHILTDPIVVSKKSVSLGGDDVTIKPERVIHNELRVGNILFVYQLAEDFVRDVLLAPYTKAVHYNRHLPVSVWERFSKLPTFEFFKDVAKNSKGDVLEILHQKYPVFLDELSVVIRLEEAQAQFLTFVFRFCFILLVSCELTVKWTSDLHFALHSRIHIPSKTVLNFCWGEPVRITTTELYFVTQQNMQTCRSLIKTMDKGNEVYFALFGPLSLANFSCKICVNIYPDDNTGLKKAVTCPRSSLHNLDFKVCTTYCRIIPDDQLLLSFKPLTPFTCASPSHSFLHTM